MRLYIEREKRKHLRLCVIYLVAINVLYIYFFKKPFQTSYNGLLFQYDFCLPKYLFGLFEMLCVMASLIRKIGKKNLTDLIICFLELLYFLPGILQQTVTNMNFGYMLYFFSFWVFLEIWSHIVKPRTRKIRGLSLSKNHPKLFVYGLIGLAIVTIGILLSYSGSFLTIKNLVYTLRNVYEVREQSSEKQIHWIIVNFEYWAAYIIIIFLAYFTEKRRWIAVLVLFVSELAVFLLEGNRIFLFLAVASIGIGMFKIDSKRLLVALTFIVVCIMIEIWVNPSGSIITDVFRRFSVVPNRLSEQYYDFFIINHNVPDYLRSFNDRIVHLLSIESPYYDEGIGKIIGRIYYGSSMCANNGLVGGAAFSFGILGPVITPLEYVFAFRIFEAAAYNFKGEAVNMAIAITLGTIIINVPGLLSDVFSISYILFLLVSLFVIGNGTWIIYWVDSYCNPGRRSRKNFR